MPFDPTLPANSSPLSSAEMRAQLTALRLTQERLAKLANLNPRTVQKIEAGDITILVTTLQ